MKQYFTRAISICMMIFMIAPVLNGCGLVMPFFEDVTVASEEAPEEQITSLGLEQDFDYEKPVVMAHIEIDQLGYLPNQKKTAVFRGDGLSNTFAVVDAESFETVYEGEIKTKTIPGTNDTYYFGDFSEFRKEGRYYIQTDVIGYSYAFLIDSDLYTNMIKDAEKQYYYNRCGSSLTSQYAGDYARGACHTDMVSLKNDANIQLDVTGGWHVDTHGDRNVVRGCDTIETLLLAYEYNMDQFGDDTDIPESNDGIPDILNEIRVETDWLLKMQEQTSGAVYEEVSVVNKGGLGDNVCHIENVDLEATLAFASSMAYFSYLYQSYDSAYATVCLKAADRAMKYAAKFVNDSTLQNQYFRAAAMMYRATGYEYYRNIINSFLEGKTEFDMSDNVVFTGCITYLATRQRTVKTYCDVMIRDLKKYAEALSASRGDLLYLMGEEINKAENSALLAEIARLTIVNYIISSNEYEVMMEKYIHYFLGCNPSNTCFVGNYGTLNVSDTQVNMDIIKQPEANAYLLLLLVGVVKKY